MYAKLENGEVIQYPYTLQQLRQDNPHTSFPTGELGDFTAFNVVSVQESAPPSPNAGHKVVEGAPTLENGTWVQTWNQVALTTEELASKKADLIQEIKTLRDYKSQNGGYTVNGKWYHSDMPSRIQQMGLVMMGANVPPELSWKSMDGSFVSMTPTLAGQIFAAAAAKDQALFAYAEVLINQVNASNDPDSIDITAGWPVGYGE